MAETLFTEICAEIIPVAKKLLASERYAVTIGGSRGKGNFDKSSDYDFRIYYDDRVEDDEFESISKEIRALMGKWHSQGIEVDGVWARSVADINKQLDSYYYGDCMPPQIDWCVWGYHVLTDIYNQIIIEDPYNIALSWKERLSVYPVNLKTHILEHNAFSLKYWRGDYHYKHKVERGDTVFLASLSARLVHEMIEIVYAMNELYFPGDGGNLTFTREMKIKPHDFEQRIEKALYPSGDNPYVTQYETIKSLIDDILALRIKQQF